MKIALKSLNKVDTNLRMVKKSGCVSIVAFSWRHEVEKTWTREATQIENLISYISIKKSL